MEFKMIQRPLLLVTALFLAACSTHSNGTESDAGSDLPSIDTGVFLDSGPTDLGDHPGDSGAESDAGLNCEGRSLGESWPHDDGCNTCTCTEDGIMCTRIHCPGDGCGDHAPGDTWEAGDGCNTCTCTEEGRVQCTAMQCPDHCGGRALGERWDHEDGCNTCSCTEEGIICTRRGCPSPGEAFTRCHISRECTVTKNTCCAVCGVPELENLQGVNISRVQDLDAHLCIGNEGCPECPTADIPGHYFATCRDSHCEARDVYDPEETLDRCHVDEDCVLTANTCCRPCGQTPGDNNTTAVGRASEATLRQLLCEAHDCEICDDPQPEPTLEAYCNENQRCRTRPVGR